MTLALFMIRENGRLINFFFNYLCRIRASPEAFIQMKYGGSNEQHERGIEWRAYKTDYGPYSGYFKIKDVDLSGK